MRRWALANDPPTIVAMTGPIDVQWSDLEVAGWLILVRPDKNVRPYMSVFVHPDWRRLGVGTRLVRHMNQYLSMWEKPLRVSVNDKAAEKFFDATGFTADR